MRNPSGEILAVAAGHMAVTASAQQQRRRLDAVERGPNVGAQKKIENRFEVPRAAG